MINMQKVLEWFASPTVMMITGIFAGIVLVAVTLYLDNRQQEQIDLMNWRLKTMESTSIMNYEKLLLPSFLNNLDRAELHMNKAVYLKAVRVTLIALGYNENFINDEFREKLEETYKD